MSQLQVTGEAKIRDIQGPVVANSGVITALDGAASQYVRGDGTLADFPTSSGGGSSVSYYLNSSVSQGTIGGVAYRELSKEPIIGAGTDIAISTTGYVASYLTDANDPDVLSIPGGNFNCEFYFSVNNNTGNPFFYAELYKYDGTTFTLLGSSVGVPEYINQGTIIAPYYFAIPVATAALALTDRLAIRIYVNVDGRTITLHTENGHLCQVVTTLSKGMVSLNNLTDQSQFLTTGTSGTNFAIVSSGDTHTFNLPIASATNTGKLSSTDWSTFNNKQAALSFTAPLVNTSNTISIPVATNLVDGYLDNTDWTTFNNKQNAITLTTTGTSGAATLVGATLNIPQYQGVLTNPVTGTGTTNTLPKFTGASTIGNSNITDSGSLITLGSNSYVNGSIGIGTSTLTEFVNIANSTNGVTRVLTTNTNAGTATQVQYQLGNGTHTASLGLTGSSFTASGVFLQGGTYLTSGNSAGGLLLNTGAAQPIYFGINNAEVARFGTNGALGIGSISLTGFSLLVGKNLTGGTSVRGISQEGFVQSDATVAVYGIRNVTRTATASFTISDYQHFLAVQATLGAGSAITNQYGFVADSTLISGVNNFGFYGNIPAAANRWNIYMNGTANNYMAGRLGIGITNAAYDLDVFSSSANVSIVSNTNNNGFSGIVSTFNSAYGNFIHMRSYGNTTASTIFGISTNGMNALWSNGDTIYAIGTIGATAMVFGTNNTERMRITSAGNVGIGTISPTPLTATALVTQINSSNTFSELRLTNSSTSNGVILAQYGLDSYLSNLANGFMVFGTNNTERARIFSNGNFGIGTGATNAGFRLDVNGTARVSGLITSNTGNNTRLFTTSGATTGHLYADILNTGGRIIFGVESSVGGSLGTGYDAYASVIASNTNTNLNLGTNGIKRLTINGSTGNAIFTSDVELNGASGTRTLTIQNNTSGNAVLSLVAAGSDSGSITYNRSTSQLVFANSGATSAFVIANNGAATFSSTLNTGGNLTIGNQLTNATLKIYADASGGDGYIKFNADSDQTKAQIYGHKFAGTGGVLEFATLQSSVLTTAMVINQVGNVLVGTTTDNGSKLQVEGSVTATTFTATDIEGGVSANYYSPYSGGSSSILSFLYGSSGSVTWNNGGVKMTLTSAGNLTITTLGGSGSRAVLADASGTLSAPVSDISVKQNITSIGYGLSEILQMNPVWFDFIDEYKNYGEGRQNGMIAQEVAEVIPEAVFVTPSTGKMGINYDQMHSVYIKAIQELEARIKQLENK